MFYFHSLSPSLSLFLSLSRSLYIYTYIYQNYQGLLITHTSLSITLYLSPAFSLSNFFDKMKLDFFKIRMCLY